MACGVDSDKQQLREVFEQIDRDGTGTVSRAEFARLVRLFTNFPDDTVNKLLSKLDWNSDGRASVEQVIEWLARPPSSTGRSRLESVSALSVQEFYVGRPHLPQRDAELVEKALHELGYGSAETNIGELVTDLQTLGVQGYLSCLPQNMPIRTRAALTRFSGELGATVLRQQQGLQSGSADAVVERMHAQTPDGSEQLSRGSAIFVTPADEQDVGSDLVAFGAEGPNSPKPRSRKSTRDRSSLGWGLGAPSDSTDTQPRKFSVRASGCMEEADPNSPKIHGRKSWRSQQPVEWAVPCTIAVVDEVDQSEPPRPPVKRLSLRGFAALPDIDPNSPKCRSARRSQRGEAAASRAEPDAESQGYGTQPRKLSVRAFGALDSVEPNSPKLSSRRSRQSDPCSAPVAEADATCLDYVGELEGRAPAKKWSMQQFGALDDIDPNSPKFRGVRGQDFAEPESSAEPDADAQHVQGTEEDQDGAPAGEPVAEHTELEEKIMSINMRQLRVLMSNQAGYPVQRDAPGLEHAPDETSPPNSPLDIAKIGQSDDTDCGDAKLVGARARRPPSIKTKMDTGPIA